MAGLVIFPHPSDLAKAAAKLFIQLGQEFIQEQGAFRVALSGGTTPRATYRLLAEPQNQDQLDWSKVHLFWGDERCVPPDHEDSNYRMVFDSLIHPLHLPESNIHRMAGELNPQEAARQYEVVLKSKLKPSNCFDLVFLGMGDDAHTASLFPGTQALDNTTDWVTANYVPKLTAWRVTLTATCINQARNVVFLVSGRNKAEPLFQVHDGNYQPENYPSQLINPLDGNLYFLVDQQAAQKIQPPFDSPHDRG
jgi:6-phosphogluconolactonase